MTIILKYGNIILWNKLFFALKRRFCLDIAATGFYSFVCYTKYKSGMFNFKRRFLVKIQTIYVDEERTIPCFISNKTNKRS